jgi:hypothetical protein
MRTVFTKGSPQSQSRAQTDCMRSGNTATNEDLDAGCRHLTVVDAITRFRLLSVLSPFIEPLQHGKK